MRIIRGLATIGTLALGIALSGAARADSKIVQSTTIDAPQLRAMLQQLSPQQKAQMGKMSGGMGSMMSGAPTISTTYISGQKTRSDLGTLSFIINKGTHKMVLLNRATHVYQIQPYNPAPAGSGPASQMKASVKDTGQTKIIMGHRAHHYKITATGGMAGTIQGDSWAAPDIAAPASMGGMSGGPTAGLQGVYGKVKGMPLQLTMVISGGMTGTMTIKAAVKSITNTPLPASTFATPPGYKPGQVMGAMGGGAGMGGGMMQ